MHVIGELLSSYQGLSRPRGGEPTLKQVYFDFWEPMQIFRINMSGPNSPNWRSTKYRTSFNSVLTLSERLSFNEQRERSVWIGSDATWTNCAALEHTNGTFTVLGTMPFIDYLTELTGLPRGDYELIAITEFLSLICFIIARVDSLLHCLVCYVGDNQNVVNWIKFRRPGNRVAKYFARVPNRLKNENRFAIDPMYISTYNDRL